MTLDSVNGAFKTRILSVDSTELGHFTIESTKKSLESWELPEHHTEGLKTLEDAARLLKASNIPVAFPTETVYGLGADATRSDAVKGIYKAKGRPSDNPLIIHICDLNMLRDLLVTDLTNGHGHEDPIPAIYKPLMDRFWPGPMTILLLNPEISRLAPEVTAGLKTVGVRMPASPLALSLIKMAGVPIAAPSANASTKPSPTTAEHVLYDMNGRIELILDGGPCEVGVESTIVDGLCHPPVVLRPGGISINSIRECPGWEGVQKAYKDEIELGSVAPRAPGMKYKHYSPKAKVILAEGSANIIPKDMLDLRLELGQTDEASLCGYEGLPYEHQSGNFRLPKIGVVRTRYWSSWGGWNGSKWAHVVPVPQNFKDLATAAGFINGNLRMGELYINGQQSFLIANIIEISLGTDTRSIAHGLFSALRELDKRDVDLIFVEGIEDDYDIFENGIGDEGDIAAAIMNRLRKAATIIKS